MSGKLVRAGAIGVWLDCGQDGRLWRVIDRPSDGHPYMRPGPHLQLEALDNGERAADEWGDFVPVSRFWCLLDDGVLEL